MSKPFFAPRADSKEEKVATPMKRGCVLWFCLFAGLVVAYTLWFDNPVLGGLCALLMLVALGLLSTPVRKREELALVRQAGYSPFRPDSTFFRDGKRVALFGYIYPLHGSGLKAPFSHKECVAYSYSVHTPAGEKSYKKYEGFCLAPSVIMTQRGDVKLFAYPDLKGFAATPESELNHRYALDHIRATSFERFKSSDLRGAYQSMIEEFMNNSGSSKKAIRFIPEEGKEEEDIVALNLAEGQEAAESLLAPDDILEEICVGIREEVCVLGTWSAARQGIISDYTETGKRVTLMKGNQQHVLESIRRKMILYPLIGLGIAAIVNLIAWWLATA